ncbi:hypothetical protein EYZ11_011018 [Aspergillus tanneri]|nr:hypothetical protein EYZ11_011018 [Aspergillus tanneri]
MAGVTPDSTTAALAGGVPKDSNKHIVGDATFRSTAPGSTTAELAQNVPFEQRANVPGTFPQTPGDDQYSVNPIPASSGAGNPISLKPGEKVPDPSTFNPNTIQSTVRTDEAGYNQDASYPLTGGQTKETSSSAASSAPKNLIPESSLPMGEACQGLSDPATIQSVAPTSTTAGLAAAVPLESQKKQANVGVDFPVSEVPDVVKNSISEAHKSPEAAANKEAVDEKKEVEKELRSKIPEDTSSGTPAPTAEAVGAETAPHATEPQPKSEQLSPRATTPTNQEPTVTTGVEETKVPKESGPGAVPPASTADKATGSTTENVSAGATTNTTKDTTPKSPSGTNGTKEKRRSRASEFFHKLKEKFK